MASKHLRFRLSNRMRLTQVRQVGYHHGNRLGYLGYGFKAPTQDQVISMDPRHFRDLQICEIGRWVSNQPFSTAAIFHAIRRRYFAWRFKYGEPVPFQLYELKSQNRVGRIPGGCHCWPSGVWYYQWAFLIAFFCYVIVPYAAGTWNHHWKHKYHW